MFEKARRIHITGLGSGILPGLARILHQRGHKVSGSAKWQAPVLAALAESGVDARLGYEAGRVDDVDLVISSPQLGVDNVELNRAREQGIEVVERAAAVVELIKGHHTIGVTGTHGRATVTSMVAWILEGAGLGPGFLASARLNNFGVEARDAQGDWFVLELDERVDIHPPVHCDFVICNFLELDPLDYYEGVGDIVERMRLFLESNGRLKEAFVNLDCLGNRELVRRVALRPTGYALDHRAEFRGEVSDFDEKSDVFQVFQNGETLKIDEESLLFQTFHRDKTVGGFALNIPGSYNVVNALGAVAVGQRMGIDREVIAEALVGYEGLENRYTVARGGGVTIAKDFVTHPTGIEQVLQSARQVLDRKLIAVFEPFSAKLETSFRKGYTKAFSHCDEVVVVSTLGEVSEKNDQIGNQELVAELEESGVVVTTIGDEEELETYLVDAVTPGDKVVFFGGDRFLRRADHLRATLASQAAKTPGEPEQPRLDGPLAQGGQQKDEKDDE